MYYNKGKVFCYNDNDMYDFDFNKKVLELKEDNLFHIGQKYSVPRLAKTYYCKICGGKNFNVGDDSCWTGIKCVKCGYEVCVHEG